MPGVLIAIEGTDGSGKATQTKLLVDRLRSGGKMVFTTSFPQYGKKSSGLVEEFLNGKYGNTTQVSPKISSLFYAVDRYDASFTIREHLYNNEIVILDRYTDSNAGHQGAKFEDQDERAKYLQWLYDLEFGILNIPKPNLVCFLHVPTEISYQLIGEKTQRAYIEQGKKRDHNENNQEYQQRSEETYIWLVKTHPENRMLIECVDGGNLLPPETIHEKLWEVVSTLIK